MINRRDFDRIKKEMQEFEDEREQLIRESRDILKKSKQTIYLVHGNEFRKAQSLLSSVENKIKEAKRHIRRNPKLDFLGAYSVAIQEYVEAQCYLTFVMQKKIPSCKKLSVQAEDYLLGLCDFTGELARRAVHAVIHKRYDEVYEIREMTEKVYGLFLELNLRNGELRKKSDSIKWNLKKIEDIIYDIETRGLRKQDS